MEEYGILTYKGRIFIPNVAYLRRVVIDEIHQTPYSSHPRYHKTIATARKQYFWPRMKKDIGVYFKVHEISVGEVSASTPNKFVASFSSYRIEMGSRFLGFYHRIANELEET